MFSPYITTFATLITKAPGIVTQNENRRLKKKMKMDKDIAYFAESAKDYIKNYPTRLLEFCERIEANEVDFVEKELTFWENVLIDIETPMYGENGLPFSGVENWETIDLLITFEGEEKIFYATKRKIEFLQSKQSNKKHQKKNSYHLQALIGAEKWELVYNYLLKENAINEECKYIKLKANKLDKSWIATFVYRTLRQRFFWEGEMQPEKANKIIKETFQLEVDESTIEKTKELKDLTRGLPPYKKK